jgi:hypothetical protein
MNSPPKVGDVLEEGHETDGLRRLRQHVQGMINRDAYAGRAGLMYLQQCLTEPNGVDPLQGKFPGVTHAKAKALLDELEAQREEIERRCAELDVEFERTQPPACRCEENSLLAIVMEVFGRRFKNLQILGDDGQLLPLGDPDDSN